MADRIVVMHQGRIEQVGAAAGALRPPGQRFVAGFIGSPAMNFFQARLSAGRLLGADGAFDLPLPARFAGLADRPVSLGVRPEHLRLLPEGAPPGPETMAFRVDVVQRLGHETLLDLAAGPHHAIARAGAEDTAAPGQTRLFALDMARAHLFDPATGANLAPASAQRQNDDRRADEAVS